MDGEMAAENMKQSSVKTNRYHRPTDHLCRDLKMASPYNLAELKCFC